MWPFKRKPPAKRELLIDENWSLSTGTHSGKPLILRINRGVSRAIGHPEFTHHVGVAVPLKAPDGNGFPGNEETEELNRIEELLCETLCADRQNLHVLTISTGGMREFVFYSSDPSQTEAELRRMTEQVTTHRLQHIIQIDPKWDIYKGFA